MRRLVGALAARDKKAPTSRRTPREERAWGEEMGLRVGGVYCLPNGRELIVLGKRQNGRLSYRLSCCTTQYEINDEGRLICDGRLTAWDISNLTDTGRSVGVERPATPPESTRDLTDAFAPS